MKRLLIANRGEIACRIARTARKMGIETVAVFSDVDREAAHVAACDSAIALSADVPWGGYLDGAQIIAAALTTGADAIHPGYGFLSENAEFAEAVRDAGLIFVGPPAEAIRAMGLKDAAKARMEAARVPVVPGYHGREQSEAALAREADWIGYPVLLKAVAGGGGKGMRVVETPEEFAEALMACRNEAVAAFGNGDVLIEKLIPSPRHIEVQVFGDAQGQVVHMFERDCSLQRRHQKVIEEAPAPGMTEEVRAAMTGAAVRAARAIGYQGAGTVEFIADGSGPLRPDGFWFMEMNTRLQVEHPVTEVVTGLDLVEWQLRVAAGEPLPLAQEQIALTGHAVEARLYAEDPASGFLPQTGRLARLSFPDGVRIDSGVREGDAVSPHYDPMVAKVIAQGSARQEAFDALRNALDAAEIAGLLTNQRFLSRLLAEPAVLAGNVSTGLIAAMPDLLQDRPSAEAWGTAALLASGLDPDAPHAGFALWAPLTWTVHFETGEVRLSVVEGEVHAEVGDEIAVVGDRAAFVDGTQITVFGPDGAVFMPLDPLDRETQGAAQGGVTAPMPGRVTRVAVAEGESVEAGQALVVLEAMKMEHTLRAAETGTVQALCVAEGDQVEMGAVLAVIAP